MKFGTVITFILHRCRRKASPRPRRQPPHAATPKPTAATVETCAIAAALILATAAAILTAPTDPHETVRKLQALLQTGAAPDLVAAGEASGEPFPVSP